MFSFLSGKFYSRSELSLEKQSFDSQKQQQNNLLDNNIKNYKILENDYKSSSLYDIDKNTESGTGNPEDDETFDEYKNLKNNIFNKLLYKIENKSVYVIELKDFDNFNLYPYRHQRDENKNHITVLQTGIKETGYLYHPIILCDISSRKELTIIDGQHRYNALKNIRMTNKQFNMIVEFEIIEIKDTDEFNSDNIVMDIYRNVNTCEPVDMRKLLVEKDYVDFIQKLKKKFGDTCIVDKKNKMKYYLIERELKKELIARELLVHYSIENLYKKIVRMNDTTEKRKSLEHGVEEGRISEKGIEKCKANNFWLAVYFPEWLDRLVPN